MSLLVVETELGELRQAGAHTVMVQADSHPDVLLSWIAWRARRAGFRPDRTSVKSWVDVPLKAAIKPQKFSLSYQTWPKK